MRITDSSFYSFLQEYFIIDSSFYSFLQEYFPAPELVFMSKRLLPLFFDAFSNAATSTYLLVSTMACHGIGVESGPWGQVTVSTNWLKAMVKVHSEVID